MNKTEVAKKKFNEMTDEELIFFINKADLLNSDIEEGAEIHRETCQEFVESSTFSLPNDDETFAHLDIDEKLEFLKKSLEERIYQWDSDISQKIQEKFDDGDELIFFYAEGYGYVLITDPSNSCVGYTWDWILEEDYGITYNSEKKEFEKAI